MTVFFLINFFRNQKKLGMLSSPLRLFLDSPPRHVLNTLVSLPLNFCAKSKPEADSEYSERGGWDNKIQKGAARTLAGHT